MISIHGSRVGPDIHSNGKRPAIRHFNPRVPCGTRLAIKIWNRRRSIFQSTGPVWDPTTIRNNIFISKKRISIHGSRVGPDQPAVGQNNPLYANFNPRVPCGTRLFSCASSLYCLIFQSTGPVWDPTRRSCSEKIWKIFQSTGPVWDPTCHPYRPWESQTHFNPRVPCGTRRRFHIPCFSAVVISIHGSRVGPDLSLPLLRDRRGISIHGSRVGPDVGEVADHINQRYFNPRVPCGTRRLAE